MTRILIIYGTTEGYTRKISNYIAGIAQQLGHEVDVWVPVLQSNR